MAVCCSVLLYDVDCGRLLRCSAVYRSVLLQCIAVYCSSVSQCIAVHELVSRTPNKSSRLRSLMQPHSIQLLSGPRIECIRFGRESSTLFRRKFSANSDAFSELMHSENRIRQIRQ